MYAGKALINQRLERGEDANKILVKGVQSVVIVEEKLGGRDFFFLKNVLLIDPIVSERMAKKIMSKKLNVSMSPVSTDH